MDEGSKNDATEMAVELTIAWLSNTSTRATTDEVVSFLKISHAALTALSPKVDAAPAQDVGPIRGAVSEKASLASRDHIISMIDGKKYRTLRRHLKTNGMTPEEYRSRYGLRNDYPMVAPSYSEERSRMAKDSGLGRKPGTRVRGTAKTA